MSPQTADDHERFADWDGAYVIGALSPAERHEFEAHLERCARCRATVAELAPLPGLLARLTPERAEALLEEAPPDDVGPSGPSPRLLELVRLDDERRARRRTRWIVTSAAAAALVAAAIVLPLLFARLLSPGPQTFAMEPEVDLPVSASVTLTDVEWGTRLDLSCHYDNVPDSPYAVWSYRLTVTGIDGSTSELSSWRITEGETVHVSAASALPFDAIRSVEIRALETDEVLLRADVDD